MNYLKSVCALILALLFCAAKDKPFRKAIRYSKDSIEHYMAKRPVPGLAITVISNGKQVWSQGFGYADLEQHVRVDPARTKFRIGSISKSLTASALARLYEQHKIILDSSVYFYIPDFPKHQYRFSVRQLAGHIAGIRHYKGNEWFNTFHYNSVSEGLMLFKFDSLNFKPGAKYQYSSHGYNLLSAVIEKGAQQDFLSFIKKEVFDPLNMINTSADINDSIISDRTRFYDVYKRSWHNAPAVDNSYKWAGGGFISTSEDIARFGNSLLGDSFLKKETIKLFTTPQNLNDGTPTNYGMGFFTGKDSKQLNYFGHSGGSVGGTTDMVIYPEQKIVVVILTNVSDAKIGALARQIAHLFMESK